MDPRRRARRRLIAIAVTLVVITAAGLGAWFFFQYQNDQKTVEVMPVTQVADYYWPEQTSSSGLVKSDYVQELFASEKRISEVFVQEGQAVSVGDPLIQYDKTRLEFDVEAKEIGLKEADLRIEDAQRQLRKYQNTKPYSPPTSPTFRPSYPTSRPTARPTPASTPPGWVPTARPTAVPGSTTTPDGYAVLHETLTLNAKPYHGSGTTEDPYVFLCSQDCQITPEFLKWLLGAGADSEQTSGQPEDSDKNENSESDENNEDGESSGEPLPGGEDDPGQAPTPVPGDEDSEPGEGSEPGSSPEPGPTPEPDQPAAAPVTQLASPFAAVFEVRQGDSNFGALISSFQLDGTKLSGGFSADRTIMGVNTMGSIASLFGATPTPAPTPTPLPESDNYNDMMYTAAELQALIAEKKQEIKELQFARKQAQLDLDKANLLLKNSTVLSTVEGVVKTLIDPDAASMEGRPFLVVSGDNACYVSGAVSEGILGMVSVGDYVTVMDYSTASTCQAQIVSISDYPLGSDSPLYYYGEGNPNSSRYEFSAMVLGGQELLNGSYVDISLNIRDDSAADALYIQNAYIREDDNGSYVMKAGKNNRLVKQYVVTGKSLWGSSLEIKSGLTVDDYIAFPYGVDVKEGVRVVVSGSEDGPSAGNGEGIVDEMPVPDLEPGLADDIEEVIPEGTVEGAVDDPGEGGGPVG